jgi:hypothetical protein
MKEDIGCLSQVFKGFPNKVHKAFFPIANIYVYILLSTASVV